MRCQETVEKNPQQIQVYLHRRTGELLCNRGSFIEVNVGAVGSHAAHAVPDVVPDAVGGLQSEQMKVPDEVVVDRQKLQIQFW